VVVAMLRLRKVHHGLRSEHHRHLKETKETRRQMSFLRARSESLRAARKLEGRNGASKKAICNTWLTGGRPRPQK
jgi:hypothetical protein